MLPLLERVAEQYSAVNQGAKSRGLHALINLIQSGHVLGDNDVPDEDAGGFEYAKDYNDDDDDGDPEIRRKHGGGDREIMAAARNGQILVEGTDRLSAKSILQHLHRHGDDYRRPRRSRFAPSRT